MKTLFLTAICSSLFTINSYASTYLGKIGPFYPNEYSEQSVVINKCNPKASKLKLVATHSHGKYSMPRFAFREISSELKSGKILSTISDNGETSIKSVFIKLPVGDCVTKIKAEAMGTGFNPGASDLVYIEVWGEK